jgi:hypothetical protein
MIDRTRRTVLAGIGAGSAALALGAFGLAGADQHEEEEDDGDNGDDGTGRVRVAHLSPDAPNVDVYVDDDPVLEDVPFGTVSDYLELATGTYRVRVVPAGEDPEEAVVDEDVELVAGDFTAAAIGELAEENQPFELAVFEDDNSDPGDDTARVGVLHASPDAPAVDVVPAGSDDAIVEDLEFGEREYVEVPTDAYRLCIYAAGDREDAVFGVDADVAGNTVHSAFAVGYLVPEDAPVDEPFDVLLTVDSEGDDDDNGDDAADADDTDDTADDEGDDADEMNGDDNESDDN